MAKSLLKHYCYHPMLLMRTTKTAVYENLWEMVDYNFHNKFLPWFFIQADQHDNTHLNCNTLNWPLKASSLKDRQQEARPILLGHRYIGGYQIPLRITYMYYISLNS